MPTPTEVAEQQRAMAAAQLQVQQVVESQKTMVKLTSKCFSACVDSPGSSLGRSSEACLWRCAQRYIETQHFVQMYCEDKMKSGTWDMFRPLSQ
mmetsp:Transcript_54356/g.100381  ORF Transcript_54356/g.100381 Transcript_54356/m.100381 type:complete len:94 (+) Transcript_54356:102-383(+)